MKKILLVCLTVLAMFALTACIKDKEVKIPIYDADIDASPVSLTEKTSITVQEKDSLEVKLQKVADALSESLFDGDQIEIKSIETVDGKQIAYINLEDDTQDTYGPWTKHFQGSAGGLWTTTVLVENFLQSKTSGLTDWVDGVQILYHNEEITEDQYDHVPDLGQIWYR